MKTNNMGLVCRTFQAIALPALVVADATTSAMAAGDFAQAGKTYDAAARDSSEGVVGTGADATAISSNEAQPADAWLNLDALELNLYGLAYHPDRKTVHRRHLDNEVNPGVALHYELVNNARGITFAEAGAYEDSGTNWAKFAAFGYQYKFGERWRIGGALAAVNSPTYNRGITFVGMIPLVTYDFGRINLNAVYFPKFSHYNQVSAFGFYIGIPLRSRSP